MLNVVVNYDYRKLQIIVLLGLAKIVKNAQMSTV